jgi:hypothetical protein
VQLLLNPRRWVFELLPNRVRLQAAGGVLNNLQSSNKDANVPLPKTEVTRVVKELKHSIDASTEPLNDDAEASHKNVLCNLLHIIFRFVPHDCWLCRPTDQDSNVESKECLVFFRMLVF